MRGSYVFALGITVLTGSVIAGTEECALTVNRTSVSPASPEGQFILANTEYRSGNVIAAGERLQALATVLRAQSPVNDKQLGLTLAKLANVRFDQGAIDDAEKFTREALDHLRSALGPSHGAYGAEMGFYATIMCAQARCAESEQILEEAIKIVRRACGEQNKQYAITLASLPAVLYRQKEIARAIPVQKRVVWILENLPAPPDSDLAEAYNNLAVLHSDQKQYSAARDYLQRAIAIWSRVLQPDHPCWINAWSTALTVAVHERKFAEAVTYIPRILDLATFRLGPDHPDMVPLLYNVGIAYFGAGMYEQAAGRFAQSLELSEKLSEPASQEYAAMLTRYSQTLRKLHRDTEARAIDAKAKNMSKILSAKR